MKNEQITIEITENENSSLSKDIETIIKTKDWSVSYLCHIIKYDSI